MSEAVAKRVARHMWDKDGRPEKDAEPTSVGRQWYEDRSKEVIAALAELGYRIVAAGRKPRASAKTTSTRS